MVFGQPPCSAGRMKHRRVYYLGLLGAATNGQCDLTELYTARFGQLTPGQKVFILSCQQKHGWKGHDSVTSAIVPPPPPPGKRQVLVETEVTTPASATKPQPDSAPAEGSSSVSRAVYKGSTPDARGEHNRLKRGHPLSIRCAPLVHGFQVALWRLRMLGMTEVGAEAGRIP